MLKKSIFSWTIFFLFSISYTIAWPQDEGKKTQRLSSKDITPKPKAPSELMALQISDNQIHITFKDNSYAEEGWILEGRFVSFNSIGDLRKPELSPKSAKVGAGTMLEFTGFTTLDNELQNPLAIVVKIRNSDNFGRTFKISSISNVLVRVDTDTSSAFAMYFPWGAMPGWLTKIEGWVEIEVSANEAIELLYLIPSFEGEATIEFGDIGSFNISAPVAVDKNLNSDLPVEFSLAQNYPNPFNSVTTITYDIHMASEVTLTVYNITGQVVATLVSDWQEAGNYRVSWDATGFPNGPYLYRLTVGEFAETKRMVLIK